MGAPLRCSLSAKDTRTLASFLRASLVGSEGAGTAGLSGLMWQLGRQSADVVSRSAGVSSAVGFSPRVGVDSGGGYVEGGLESLPSLGVAVAHRQVASSKSDLSARPVDAGCDGAGTL